MSGLRRSDPAYGSLPIVAAAGHTTVLALLTATLLLITAEPARAHAGSGAEPTNYRVTVTSAPDPVAVQVGVGGQWVRVRLTDPASGTVEVLGYRGEPFLRISANGAALNTRSIVARDNPRLASRGSDGGDRSPFAAAPYRVSLGRDASVAWRDDRLSSGTGSWRLALRIDGEPAAITGTRTYVEPPPWWPWVCGLLAVTVATAGLGWRRRWRPSATAGLVAAGCASAAHLVGAALAPQPGSAVSSWLSALFTGVLCWPIAVIALVLVVRRREHAPFAVAIAGAVFALVSGPEDLAVLWRSQLPFAWPAALERGLVVVTVGVGAGLAVAGIRQLRRPTVPPPSDECHTHPHVADEWTIHRGRQEPGRP